MHVKPTKAGTTKTYPIAFSLLCSFLILRLDLLAMENGSLLDTPFTALFFP